MSNLSTNTISRFTGTGPGTYSTIATTVATGLNNPYGLAFDGQGDLFVANLQSGTAGTGSITKVAPTGAGTFGPGTTFAPSLSRLEGLAFDAPRQPVHRKP